MTIIVFTYFINPQITPSFLRLIATFGLEGSPRAKLHFHHFWKTTYFRYGIDCFSDKLLNELILPIFCLGSLLQPAVHQLRYGHCWLSTALQLKYRRSAYKPLLIHKTIMLSYFDNGRLGLENVHFIHQEYFSFIYLCISMPIL